MQGEYRLHPDCKLDTHVAIPPTHNKRSISLGKKNKIPFDGVETCTNEDSPFVLRGGGMTPVTKKLNIFIGRTRAHEPSKVTASHGNSNQPPSNHQTSSGASPSISSFSSAKRSSMACNSDSSLWLTAFGAILTCQGYRYSTCMCDDHGARIGTKNTDHRILRVCGTTEYFQRRDDPY